MTDNASNDYESIAPRTLRAVTECMTVLEEGTDVYSVTSQSGREYLVDANTGACDCHDAAYNLSGGEKCKHARRVAIVTGEAPMPAVDPADVDPQLGANVTPRVAADGGEVEVEDEGECEECAGLPDDFPCADCYINGEKELPESRESDADGAREVSA